MKHFRIYLSIVRFLATYLVSVPAVTAGSLQGTVVIEIPYNELAKNESADALMMITNTGIDMIPYWGNKSGLTIYPEQAVIKWFNRSDGLRTPLGEDAIGLKMNWDEFKNDALSTIPAGGTAFFKIYNMGNPIYDGAPPRDSVIAEVIVGKDTFLSSDIVNLPVSSEVDPAALPSIATLKWSDGMSVPIKRAVIGRDEYILAVTEIPGCPSVRRVARIPPGCDVSISHDPVVGRQPDGVLRKMTVSFTGGKYEDLVYNAGRYHILSGHPDTVPNAFMRLSKDEATAEEARKCLEENSRKPWLKSFGKIPVDGGSKSGDGKSSPARDGPQPSLNKAGESRNRDTPDRQLPPAGASNGWVAWLAATGAAIGGGWLIFLLIRARRK